jgi:flagellar basal-body rod protein FlgB
MSFADVPLFGLLQQKMSWLGSRQDVLARNIANASTPGYVPHDLKQADFSAALSAVATQAEMAATHARHLQGRASSGGAFRTVEAPGSQSSPDGNSVVLEEQAMKVAETQLAYSEAAGLYKKMIAMWRTALGGSHA